jgi:hypothetical protein
MVDVIELNNAITEQHHYIRGGFIKQVLDNVTDELELTIRIELLDNIQVGLYRSLIKTGLQSVDDIDLRNSLIR